MDKPIIDDELWRRLEPLLPQPKARREKYPGRKPVPDRVALNGIVFVLGTGCVGEIYPPKWVAAPA